MHHAPSSNTIHYTAKACVSVNNEQYACVDSIASIAFTCRVISLEWMARMAICQYKGRDHIKPTSQNEGLINRMMSVERYHLEKTKPKPLKQNYVCMIDDTSSNSLSNGTMVQHFDKVYICTHTHTPAHTDIDDYTF